MKRPEVTVRSISNKTGHPALSSPGQNLRMVGTAIAFTQETRGGLIPTIPRLVPNWTGRLTCEVLLADPNRVKYVSLWNETTGEQRTLWFYR